MKIGTYELPNRVFAAPMAGIADRPLRRLWRALGAGYAVGEMTTADPRLRNSAKTSRRLRIDSDRDLDGTDAPTGGPVAVQLAGADPAMLADAARYSVDLGAQIIDINMGCPAKKVCNAACGSALLRDEELVARIISAVVAAVTVPVTLKLRTGWAPDSRNAVRIGQLAEAAGVQMLTMHGRTRACGFGGNAEYDTIAEVKSRVAIPVVANGDIDSPEKAQLVLAYTGADAVMIGRAAQARPWIFREIDYYLRYGRKLPQPTIAEVRPLLLRHLDEHYLHYGEPMGARTVRKRIHFLARGLRGGADLSDRVNRMEDYVDQRRAFEEFLQEAAARGPFFEYIGAAVPVCGSEHAQAVSQTYSQARLPVSPQESSRENARAHATENPQEDPQFVAARTPGPEPAWLLQ
jgi:tRNA-dihydrouridine synthase B